MASIRAQYPDAEPEWLQQANRYERFMHYTPIEVFMVGGSLIGGTVGLGAYLLWLWMF